jgi:hypothetical protein
MKTRLLATGLLLAMSSIALADRGPAGPPPGFDIDKLEILLDLDAYQKSEVQKILDTQREAMHTKREQLRNSDTRPSFEEMQKEREAAQAATRTQLSKILSEQQLKKFDVLTERPQMRGGHSRSDATRKGDAK